MEYDVSRCRSMLSLQIRVGGSVVGLSAPPARSLDPMLEPSLFRQTITCHTIQSGTLRPHLDLARHSVDGQWALCRFEAGHRDSDTINQ